MYLEDNSRRGLGFAPVLAAGAATGPAAPFVIGGTVITSLVAGALPRVGAGRNEADIITPVQNALHRRLDEINAGIDSASIPQLQAWYGEVMKMAAEFRAFVTDPRFTDGRASRQALDTIMPLIDGTDSSGYPCTVNAWGNPCEGGTAGTIARQIVYLGGMVAAPQITQGGMGPSLQTQMPGLPYLPQSGYLAPVSPLSPIRSAGIITVPSAQSEMLGPLVVAGGLALLFFGRRKR